MDLTENRINLITASLLLILNIFALIFEKPVGLDRYINILIPIVAFIFIFILRNKNIYFFYSIVGFLITGFTSQANFSGSVFFYISMSDNKSKKNILLNIILMVIGIGINVYKSGYVKVHMFSMAVAFFFIISHMYNRFWNSHTIDNSVARNKGFTPEQISVIEYLDNGVKHVDAAKELHIERNTYSARVASLRKRYNVENDFQLAISLAKDGVISLNELTNAKIEDKPLNKLN